MRYQLGLLPCAAMSSLYAGTETPTTYVDGQITSGAVLPPIGTFLLLRKADSICALKFTGMWRGNDAESGTPFHSGQESFRSRYSWYLGARDSERWTIHPPKAQGLSELTQGRLVGIGRFAFGTGNIRIDCGPIRVKWSAPAHVYFYYPQAEDQGIQIAATRWTNFDEVEPNDPNLQWFGFDIKRPTTRIPSDR